jgi:transglutaminase-like putative cysteine protease
LDSRRLIVPEDLSPFLTAGPAVQSDHPAVIDYASGVFQPGKSDRDNAIALYYKVRDDIRYDPYSSSVRVDELKASHTLDIGRGWCVSKAILLAAVCRVAGIPARMGYADVRNHMSTAKMRERMQTDVFYWHSYTSIHLDGQWVKATPAFNIELCDKFGLKPLEFDGVEDSLYHPHDKAGNRHMEYLNDRGEFAEPPVDAIRATFVAEYPHWKSLAGDAMRDAAGDFDSEVDAETRAGS